MALNQELKGKEYQEIAFEVDRDRVTQFADAIGDQDPVVRDAEAAREAGLGEQVAPPTFPTVLGILASVQVVTDPDLRMDYSRVVHGEQEFDWRRPIEVGDSLRATPRIADLYSRGRNEFLVIEAEVRDQDGEVVCIARSTLLSRGTAA